MVDYITIRIAPSSINYLNRIMEGYEYLGVVTTIDRCQGIVKIRTTPDALGEVQTILANLDIDIEYIK